MYIPLGNLIGRSSVTPPAESLRIDNAALLVLALDIMKAREHKQKANVGVIPRASAFFSGFTLAAPPQLGFDYPAVDTIRCS